MRPSRNCFERSPVVRVLRPPPAPPRDPPVPTGGGAQAFDMQAKTMLLVDESMSTD
jgi:hypothetical protein